MRAETHWIDSPRRPFALRAARLVLACGFTLWGTCLPAGAQSAVPANDAGAIQLSRYTTTEPHPDAAAANPLAVVASVTFPRARVQSVGDAIRHLLVRTGYQLAAEDQLDEHARALLVMPLPESQRQLGPYRVDEMLMVLLGTPWTLQIDSLARTVRFMPANPAAASPAAVAGRS